jgi:outer membrane protein OmpA-like peptidoglycan-associated protein
VVALEGHAAANEHTPMRLSLARASSVRIALQGRGVEADRLLARASGSTSPACTQMNEACWSRERTVEFITLPAAKSTTDAPEAANVETAPAAPPGPAPADKPATTDGTAATAAAIPLQRVDFKKGSAVLAPSALGDLDLLAGFMKANPVSVEIVGYADEREHDAAALAEARAGSVKKYMMACGVSGQHLTTRAERTSRATCRSHSAACPARASRAELRFLEPEAPTPPAGAGAP